MATEAQIAANRRNSLRSTGPTTQEGKARVSQNATRHGLLTGRKLIPGEDPAELAELEKEMLEALRPVGAVEVLLVKRIVENTFRLRRLARVESGLFAYRIYDIRAKIAAAEAQRQSNSNDGLLESLMMGQATDKELYETARAEQRTAEELRDEDLPTLGQAFLVDQKGFSTLSRYEVSLERGMHKALHELERLQRLRAGEDVPAPVAVDVEVITTSVDPSSDVNLDARGEPVDKQYA